MLIKCVTKKPTENEIEILGETYKKSSLKQDTHLTIGKTYVALGLLMNTSYPSLGKGTWVKLLCDYGHIESYPMFLFEIISGKVDSEWIISKGLEGLLQIEPEIMQQPHFAEDYLDGIPEVVLAFKNLYKLMEKRANGDVLTE